MPAEWPSCLQLSCPFSINGQRVIQIIAVSHLSQHRCTFLGSLLLLVCVCARFQYQLTQLLAGLSPRLLQIGAARANCCPTRLVKHLFGPITTQNTQCCRVVEMPSSGGIIPKASSLNRRERFHAPRQSNRRGCPKPVMSSFSGTKTDRSSGFHGQTDALQARRALSQKYFVTYRVAAEKFPFLSCDCSGAGRLL